MDSNLHQYIFVIRETFGIFRTFFIHFHVTECYKLLKVHKHEIFYFIFFAETEALWSQGPITRDFWKSYSVLPRYSTLKNFRVCSLFSQRWNPFRVCSASDEIRSAYAQHILNDESEMGCDLLFCWAYAEIGYSLAEHTRKLVTR
jgi:hypothetical protein